MIAAMMPSVRETESIDPKRNALRSVLTPAVDTAMTPMASADEEIRAKLSKL